MSNVLLIVYVVLAVAMSFLAYRIGFLKCFEKLRSLIPNFDSIFMQAILKNFPDTNDGGEDGGNRNRD